MVINFAKDVLNHDAELTDYADYIRFFIKDDTGRSLQDILGFSDEEFTELCNENVTVNEIMRCRAYNFPFNIFMEGKKTGKKTTYQGCIA